MSQSRYPRSFWIMCLGALCFFLSFNIILPELSHQLKRLHGENSMSWLIAIFSISALIARPISGWITDNLGRKVAMIGGCVFCIIAGIGYPFASTVSLFLMFRAIHGFSTGFTPTGFTAFTSDTIAKEHRGQAMGWQGTFNNIGSSLGYLLGSFIVMLFGATALFLTSAALALTALSFFSMLPETRPENIKRPFRFSIKNLFYIPSWKPGVLMLLVCVSLGSILTLMPDYTKSLGYLNSGTYLTVYISVSLLFRMVSGRVSDKLGRPWSTAIGTGAQCISMALIVFVPNPFGFFSSAFFYGIGQGFNAPSLFAWASDTADSVKRGWALASLFMALELGIILGGYFGGKLFYSWGYSANTVFLMNGCCFVVAFILSLIWIKFPDQNRSIGTQNYQ